MKLTTSYCKPNIIKHDFKQYGWITILYSMAFFILGPIPIILDQKNDYTLGLAMDIIDFQYDPLLYLYIGVPLFAGMFLFKYLHSEKSAGVIHSLPYKRTELLNSHCIAGIIIVSVPIIMNGFIMGIMSMFMDLGAEFTLIALSKWILFILLIQVSLFVFSVTAAMITGNSAAQIVLGFIVLWLPIGIFFLIQEFLNSLLYGYSNYGSGTILYKLSPLTYIYERGYMMQYYSEDNVFMFIFLIQSVIFYILALKFYKYKKIEKSGDVITFNSIKSIFKYGVTACSSLYIGLLMLGVSRTDEYDPMFYMGFIIGAIVGYIVAELVLTKSIIGIKRYRGLGVFMLSAAILFIGIGVDALGFEKSVPSVEDVKNVQFRSDGRRYSGGSEAKFQLPEDIEKVINLHKAIIESKDNNDLEKNNHLAVIVYKLKDNSTLERAYNFNSEAPISLLKEIVNTDIYRRSEHKIFDINSNDIDMIRFNWKFIDHSELTITDKNEIDELFEFFKQNAFTETYKERYESNLRFSDVSFLSQTDEGLDSIASESFDRSNVAVEQWLTENYGDIKYKLSPEYIEEISVMAREDLNNDGYIDTDVEQFEAYLITDESLVAEVLKKASNDLNWHDDGYVVIINLKVTNQNIRLSISKNDIQSIMGESK